MYSARNENDAKRLHWFLSGFDYLPMPDEVWDRAKDIQRQAIAKGNHRARMSGEELRSLLRDSHPEPHPGMRVPS